VPSLLLEQSRREQCWEAEPLLRCLAGECTGGESSKMLVQVLNAPLVSLSPVKRGQSTSRDLPRAALAITA